MTRAGLEQTCCCVGDTKGSLWEVSTEGACAGEGCDHEGVGEWALSNHHWAATARALGLLCRLLPSCLESAREGCMRDGGGGPEGQLRSPARPAFRLLCLPSDSPLPSGPCWGSLPPPCFSEASAGPTFSMRPAFSAVLSRSLCSLSLSLCSLAFSLSRVSIWARWVLPEVAKEAWVLAGPSTPGGLRAASCGGGWRS